MKALLLILSVSLVFTQLNPDDKEYLKTLLNTHFSSDSRLFNDSIKETYYALSLKQFLKLPLEDHQILCSFLIDYEKSISLLKISEILNCPFKFEFIAKQENTIYNLYSNLYAKSYLKYDIDIPYNLQKLSHFASNSGIYFNSLYDDKITNYTDTLIALKILTILHEYAPTNEQKDQISNLTDVALENMSEDFRKSSSKGFIVDKDILKTNSDFLEVCRAITLFNKIENLLDYEQAILPYFLEAKYDFYSLEKAYYGVKALFLLKDWPIPMISDTIERNKMDSVPVTFTNSLGEPTEAPKFSILNIKSEVEEINEIPVKWLKNGLNTVHVEANIVFPLKITVVNVIKFKSIKLSASTGDKTENIEVNK